MVLEEYVTLFVDMQILNKIFIKYYDKSKESSNMFNIGCK